MKYGGIRFYAEHNGVVPVHLGDAVLLLVACEGQIAEGHCLDLLHTGGGGQNLNIIRIENVLKNGELGHLLGHLADEIYRHVNKVVSRVSDHSVADVICVVVGINLRIAVITRIKVDVNPGIAGVVFIHKVDLEDVFCNLGVKVNKLVGRIVVLQTGQVVFKIKGTV